MNYYNEIKNKIIDNKIYLKIKDYSKERYKLKTYIEIGELLYNANNQYGDKIIKEYSRRLSIDLNKNYSVRYLFDIRKLYLFIKVHPLGSQLTISHCRLLFRLKNDEEIEYYINQSLTRRLGKRELELIIKNKEYDRLPVETRTKLINNDKLEINDLVPNPILINNNTIGIIICKKENKFVIEYCSDERITVRKYELV